MLEQEGGEWGTKMHESNEGVLSLLPHDNYFCLLVSLFWLFPWTNWLDDLNPAKTFFCESSKGSKLISNEQHKIIYESFHNNGGGILQHSKA